MRHAEDHRLLCFFYRLVPSFTFRSFVFFFHKRSFERYVQICVSFIFLLYKSIFYCNEVNYYYRLNWPIDVIDYTDKKERDYLIIYLALMKSIKDDSINTLFIRIFILSCDVFTNRSNTTNFDVNWLAAIISEQQIVWWWRMKWNVNFVF